jgi:hypothetical protein
VTYPTPPPVPYQPFSVASPLRALYQSLVQVYRLKMKVSGGTPTLTWNELSDVIDPFVAVPGQMMCRLDLGFIKRGDMPMPVSAGRAPDRQGTVFFDSVIDPDTGAPYVLAGDRLFCIAGPVMGTFEIRQIPTAAVGLAGAHHVECMVFEVAQSIAKGSQTPFPGSEGPES